MNRRAIAVPGLDGAQVAGPARVARQRWMLVPVFAGIGCLVGAVYAQAQNLKLSASASATETYTSNVNYGALGPVEGDFATTLTASLGVSGGGRFKLNGSVGATAVFYAQHAQDSSIGFSPSVNLAGTIEAIDKFAFVDVSASVTPSFISPFGPQPTDLANATNNRFVSQTYAVSPYIRGGIPGSNVTYQLRDDNIWTAASQFGGSAPRVPSTYSNGLTGSMSSPPAPWGWTLEYSGYFYNNGADNVEAGALNTYATQSIRLIVPYQIDPQLQIAPRIGYEGNRFPIQDQQGTIYGIGGNWRPTDRTQVGGFWEERFFGSSYSAQLSHRLPNAAISANFSRGLTSYPQLALAIPAGATVAQFLDAAFTTRIPDPAERAIAVQQFLAQTGLPPTLASPVNFYGATLTLQQTATVSLVLIGVLNTVSFTAFRVTTEAISGSGSVLPPALQFGQNNTQTGVGVAYSRRLSGSTNFGANVGYSTATLNGDTASLSNPRSNNASAGISLGTQLGAKTTASAGITYSRFESPGSTNFGTSSSVNAFATVSHTF